MVGSGVVQYMADSRPEWIEPTGWDGMGMGWERDILLIMKNEVNSCPRGDGAVLKDDFVFVVFCLTGVVVVMCDWVRGFCRDDRREMWMQIMVSRWLLMIRNEVRLVIAA